MSNQTDAVNKNLSGIEQNMINVDQVASTLTPAAINKDLGLTDPMNMNVKDAKPEETAYVDGVVDQLFNRDFSDPAIQVAVRESMARFQSSALQDAQFKSEKLQQPMMKVAGTIEGNKLMDALTDLDIKMKGLHPKSHDLNGNWLQKLIATILPAFRPVRKYFMMLQNQQTVLDGMRTTVLEGIDEREKDGRILQNDKLELSKCAFSLEKAIRVGLLLDEKMEYNIERNITDAAQKQFMQSEVLFTLRQTVRALQEQLAVTNQGITAMELLLRLNRETINSGKRTLNVAMHALSIAGVLATVMAGMREFNEKITAMKQTANDFIAYNGDLLQETATEVGEISRSTTLDIGVLEAAFDKIHTAYENEINLRVGALGTMKQEMNQLTAMNSKSKEQIERMEKGRNASGAISEQLDLSSLPESVKVI